MSGLDLTGLSALRQLEGKHLCLSIYSWLEEFEPEDFDILAKTILGGALIFVANQYASEYDRPVFYLGMHDEENHD